MHTATTAYLLLGIAIISEVIGSTFLAQSAGFSKLLPACITLACFAVAFFLLAQVVRTIPLGITYAIWSGAGIVLTALAGYFLLGQRLDVPALAGIGLIVAGVLVIQIFSQSAGTHQAFCGAQHNPDLRTK